MNRIDRSKMNVQKKGFWFTPFRPEAKHEQPLAEAGLSDDKELLVFERGNQRRATLLPEMLYHHVVQGELAGEPYLVSF